MHIALSLSLIRAESGVDPTLRVSHQAAYGDTLVAARHQAPYAVRFAVAHAAPYRILRDHAARFDAAYALSETDPVRSAMKAGYSLLPAQAVYSAAIVPELTHGGRVVRLDEETTLTLSCDEDSPVWIATIGIAELADFAAMRIGDALTLALAGETFALVVDGKTLSRGSAVSRRCDITASSPLALLDKPFAADISFQATAPTLARTAVEAFIGVVDWRLPAWVIPAAALTFDGVTPLRAARAIVEAIGGLVESDPDGTVICRPRHPVGVPQYGAAAVAHQFFDNDVLESSERIAPVRGFNRVTVANEQTGASGASGSPDALEYVGDDSISGTVRAYPNPARPVSLVHTGNPATTIAPQGTITRSETELAEFVSGRARVRYPVAAIVSSDWQATDLGEVTAEGAELKSAVEGYSLLRITYEVSTVNWAVGLDTPDEEVQFVLMDA